MSSTYDIIFVIDDSGSVRLFDSMSFLDISLIAVYDIS